MNGQPVDVNRRLAVVTHLLLAFAVTMISEYLDVPLPFQMVAASSRSSVLDHAAGGELVPLPLYTIRRSDGFAKVG